MIAASQTLRIGALLLLSSLSLVLLFFVFEYQYMWHVKHVQFLILRGGFAVGTVTLIALWVFFPSYWAVAAIGVLVLAFPVFVPDVPSIKLSLAFVGAMTLSLALLIGTTALRQNLFPQ